MYRKLGNSGLDVSTLCLGTMTFGEADENSFMHGVGASEETSFAIMDKALDAGINFFDTADVYGQDGLSERVIGKWFAQGGRRDQVVLATKFRFRMSPGANGTGASRRRIVKTVEDSLRRLQTDRIDLYQIHMQDTDTPEQETLRALDDLVRAGKVLYIGASNYAAYRLTESLLTADRLGLERFVSLQAQYSLVVRELEREHVPACVKYGVGIIPWSPLAGGFLSGKYYEGQTPPSGSRFEKWKQRYDGFNTPRNWQIIKAVRTIALEHESTPAAVSLAWLLRKPGVTSVIFGARDLGQLDDNLAAASLELSVDDVDRLDQASVFDLGYPYTMIKNVQGRW
jgi:aryl-alcohol dehydrogenase-like predicted oxidoreductase